MTQIKNDNEKQLQREVEQLKHELKHAAASTLLQTESLVREHNLLRTLIDNLPDYIYFKDTRSRFIDANKATLRIMKCATVGELIGKTDFNFYPQEFAEKYYEDEREIIRTGVPKLNMEERIINENNRLRVLSTSKVPLKDGSGNVIGIVGMGRDITEHKNAQEVKLEKAKRLSEIGALAATVAHELRNPLAIIRASSFFLRKEPGIQSNVHLDNIEKEVAESYQIIDNLLSYSRIKPPSLRRVNLAAILNECISSFQIRFKDQDIVIEKYYDEKITTIEADPLQIREIFTNILNNAGQAFPGNTGQIDVIFKLEGNHVRIGIKDNGTGIDPENLEKIFMPFFSLKPQGTGLGLSLCQELVNLHHGRIEVASFKDKGTIFSIILPISKPQ